MTVGSSARVAALTLAEGDSIGFKADPDYLDRHRGRLLRTFPESRSHLFRGP